MTRWKYKVNITHLYTKFEDYDSVKICINNIGVVLNKHVKFSDFKELKIFNNFPEKEKLDELEISSVDFGNSLLELMYDYADTNRIWVN